MSENNNHYQKWLKKVEEDELSTKAVLKEGSPSTGCFLSQQMAEKALKALLVYRNKDFPKIHDLTVLAKLIEPIAPEIENHKEDIKLLGRYYVETRYPGDYPEFTFEECREAFEAATRIKEFVLDKIK